MHINHDQFADLMERSLRGLLETAGAKDAPLDALKAVLALAARFTGEDTPEQVAVWGLREMLAEPDEEKRLGHLDEMIKSLQIQHDYLQDEANEAARRAGIEHADYIRQHSLTFRDVL